MTTESRSNGETGLRQLSSDFIKLYTSGAGADVTFAFPDGELNAHKAILCSRVDYFKTMFAAGMKESLTNRVDISGTDKECYDVFLRYVYGGRLPDEFNVESQLNLAKMYDVPTLITDCLPMLKKNLAELLDVDCCVNEARRMMATYEIEAIKALFEDELLNRINAVVPKYDPRAESPQQEDHDHDHDPYSMYRKCQSCEERSFLSKLPTVPASFIDPLITILIFSHTEKYAKLKAICLKRFARMDPEGQFKPQIAKATKKLAEHPDLLVEMVLHFRNENLSEK